MPAAEWDSIVPSGRPICTHAYLAAIEDSRIEDCRFRYLVAYDEHGLAAHCCLYFIANRLDTFATGVWRWGIDTIRRVWPGFLVFRSLECGTPVALGTTLCFRDQRARSRFFATLVQQAEAVAEEQGVRGIVFRDFTDRELPHLEPLRQAGYRRVPNLSTAVLRLRWRSFPEYLQAMRSAYRRKIRGHRRRFQQAGGQVEHIADFADQAETLAALWRQTYDRAREYRRELLLPDYFRAMGRLPNDMTSVLLARVAGTPAGFALLMREGDRLSWVYCGLDYERNESAAVYFNLVLAVVEAGIAAGVHEIDLGITTLQPKLEVGAAPVPLWMYMKYRRAMVGAVVPRVFHALTPRCEPAPRRVMKMAERESNSQPPAMAPEDTATELKCVVAIPILRGMEETLGAEGLRQAVHETGMSLDYLENANHWIGYNYFCRLLRKLVEVTGSERAPYDAAMKHSNSASYRAVGRFIRHVSTPSDMFRGMPRFSRLWSKVNAWEARRIERNRAVMAVFPLGYPQDANNCLAIQGSLAAVPRQYGLGNARIVEKECACQGADACVYEITWEPSPAWRSGLLLGFALWAFGCWLAMLTGWGALSLLLAAAFGLVGVVLGRFVEYRKTIEDLDRQNTEQSDFLLENIKEIENLNRGLQAQVESRTAELSRTNAQLQKALSDLQSTQQKALQAEREAAIGVLASGMAHEMNSPINAIRLSVQGARESLDTDSPANGFLETAERATGRCRRIVSDLLSFSREPRLSMRQDLREILASTVSVFTEEDGGDVRVVSTCDEDLPTIRLDRSQIRQAVLNLLNNAADAMHKKGNVRVSLRRGPREVVLSIADDGPGMTTAVKERLFEPFFTTKSGGRGTGLGLSITQQLIRRNGGTIEAESEPGVGTTFRIRFPVDADMIGPDDAATGDA